MSRRVTQREQPEHSCRLQLLEWPDTAEPCRAKDYPLHPRRSYFAPIKSCLAEPAKRFMVEAPGTAPGSDRFITISIYRYSWRTSAPNIVRSDRIGKMNTHELTERRNRATSIPQLWFTGSTRRRALRLYARRHFARKKAAGLIVRTQRRGESAWPRPRKR